MRSEDAKERARDGRGFGRDEMFDGLFARASRARTTRGRLQRRRESIFPVWSGHLDFRGKEPFGNFLES